MLLFGRNPVALLIVTLLPCATHARLTTLFSSSVTYCSTSTPDSLVVQRLDARYVKDNSSLVFDITASTRVKTLNVTAKITLNAYGLEPVDLSFNLCELSKALCPLPLYNFSGSGTIPIPAIREKIPGIAYILPDFEAAATLRLVQIGTNNTVACVQTTLSNGWSMRQRAVSWAIGGFALFTIIISIALTMTDVFTRSSSQAISSFSTRSSLTTLALRNPRTILSSSPLLYRFLTLLLFLQHIVSSAFLDLNYPLAYRSFVVNFAWAFGLFSSSLDSRLQRSMNNLRSKTGSKDADQGSLSAIAYGNRNQSPYNGVARRQFITPATVSPTDEDALPGGIPLFTNTIGIATGNAFLSLFYVLLIGICILMVVAAIGFGIVWVVSWRRRGTTEKRSWAIEQRYQAGVRAIGLRALLAVLGPALTLVFFQWTIGDSWLAVLLSVVVFLAVISATAYTAYVLVASHRKRRSILMTATSQHTLYGLLPYVEQTNPSRWFYTVYVLVPIIIIKSAITSFAKASGLTQVVAFIILSLAEFLLLIILRPAHTRRSDILEGFLAIVRLITSGCLVAFVESVAIKPIPRVAVAFIIVVLESIAILVLFFNFMIDLAKLTVSGVRWMLLPEEAKGVAGTSEVMSGRPSSATLAAPPGMVVSASSSSKKKDSVSHSGPMAAFMASAGKPSETVESSAASTVVGSPRASTSELSAAAHHAFMLPGDRDLVMSIGPLVSRR